MSRRAAGTAAAAAGVLAAALLLGGCGDDAADSADSADAAPELSATGAFIPAPATGDVAAGFLTLHNAGDADDALTSADSDIAGTVEIHETADNAMRQVESLTVPAGGELRLSRGGNHLMLLDLSRTPAEGETVSIELHFETSDPITLDVPVEAATHTGE